MHSMPFQLFCRGGSRWRNGRLTRDDIIQQKKASPSKLFKSVTTKKESPTLLEHLPLNLFIHEKGCAKLKGISTKLPQYSVFDLFKSNKMPKVQIIIKFCLFLGRFSTNFGNYLPIFIYLFGLNTIGSNRW